VEEQLPAESSFLLVKFNAGIKTRQAEVRKSEISRYDKYLLGPTAT
jgi:hypothetical protein